MIALIIVVGLMAVLAAVGTAVFKGESVRIPSAIAFCILVMCLLILYFGIESS